MTALTMFNVKPSTPEDGFAAWVAARDAAHAAEFAVACGAVPASQQPTVADLTTWVSGLPYDERESIEVCLAAGVPGRMSKMLTERVTFAQVAARAAAGGPPRTGRHAGRWTLRPL